MPSTKMGSKRKLYGAAKQAQDQKIIILEDGPVKTELRDIESKSSWQCGNDRKGLGHA